MKIAYVDPHSVPDTLPATLQILHTVDALAEVGVNVNLITPRPCGGLTATALLGRELALGARFHYLPDLRRRWWFPSSSNKPFYFLARQLLQRTRYDAVLVRNLKLADYLLDRPIAFRSSSKPTKFSRKVFASNLPTCRGRTTASWRRWYAARHWSTDGRGESSVSRATCSTT